MANAYMVNSIIHDTNDIILEVPENIRANSSFGKEERKCSSGIKSMDSEAPGFQDMQSRLYDHCFLC